MAIRKIVSRSIGTDVIVAEDIANNAITVAELANGAVTNVKIASGAISTDKLDSTAIRSGLKNRIINGAMVIDQRNAGASVTNAATTTYTLDRWQMFGDQASKFSVQQVSTTMVGFTYALKVTSLSAYTLTTDDRFFYRQKIEGYNIADLGWGTANAKAVTLSFKVKSSLTGTFGGSIQNGAGDRSYPFTYTIASANTETSVSITVAGDTSGTWLTTNGIGIVVNIGLGVQGSTYAGTAGAWASANYYSATGATSVVSTNGATLEITGVQLEVGASATGYEYRQYGQELALCQRYYQNLYFDNVIQFRGSDLGTGAAQANLTYLVQTRTTPTIAFPSSGTSTGSLTAVASSGFAIGTNSVRVYSGNNISAGQVYQFSCNMTVSAEL